MKTDCEIIRDLLPLYVDDICSEKSRELVDEHLKECAECNDLLDRLRRTEIESDLKKEKEDALSYGVQKFKQLTARTGITASGLFMIPLLALLGLNLIAGSQLGWFLIVLAALAVAASVIAVPILVPESKLFWTLCAFTASTELLLGVICLVTRGNWFGIAGSAVLFGLAVCFLPWAIRAKPLQKVGREPEQGADRVGRRCYSVPEHDDYDPFSQRKRHAVLAHCRPVCVHYAGSALLDELQEE